MYSNILQYFKNHFLLLFSSLETWLIDSGVVWCWIIRNLENLGFSPSYTTKWLPWWLISKESACQCRRQGFDPWVGKISWRRKQQPTPVFLPGKSHGQRSLTACSPWGQKRAARDWVTKQQQDSSTMLGHMVHGFWVLAMREFPFFVQELLVTFNSYSFLILKFFATWSLFEYTCYC